MWRVYESAQPEDKIFKKRKKFREIDLFYLPLWPKHSPWAQGAVEPLVGEQFDLFEQVLGRVHQSWNF